MNTRGHVAWSADAQQLLDTQAGTAGMLPHMSQLPWEFSNQARTQLCVDGAHYRKGYGDPGGSNNCLIDSLRQCVPGLACDVQAVRRDLQAEFGDSFGHDPRRRVTGDSYLDVDIHWQAILRSLLLHNTSGLPRLFEVDNYCVVALFGNRPGHGVVLGNASATYRLVVVNWGDVHFDPCLPC